MENLQLDPELQQITTLTNAPAPGIRPALVGLMAFTCALVVGNIYYNQPLLAEIGKTFGLSDSRVSLVATITQVGYTLGLLLVVPLGDKLERKRLTLLLLLGAAGCMALAGYAPTFGVLVGASLLVGLCSSVPQLLLPMAAHLASPTERGRVVGTIMSGLLIGILLSRTVSGYVGAHLGWRMVFWGGGAAMVLLTGVLALALPRDQPTFTGSYGHLMRSVVALARQLPLLRRSALVGLCMFAGFSAFWTTLVFYLESPAYHLGADAAGLFGLLGAAGALAAPLAGKSADRRGPEFAIGLGVLLFVAAYGLMAVAGGYLVGLIVGVVLLDVGQQATHISNQSRIFALLPEARSRLNTVYMTSVFVGGSLGSFVGAHAWEWAGWAGVCGVGLAFGAGAFLLNRRPVAP